MFSFLKKWFDFNEKELTRMSVVLKQINQLESEVVKLKEKDFLNETEKLKEQIQSGKKNLDDVIPRAFALVREAAKRVLGQRHFDVQLLSGIALHEGNISEQKTGEGKTLSATCALYLNALTGKGAHLVTVNDYLARIGTGWMGPVFDYLGMTTSAIIGDKSFIYDKNYTEKESQDWRLAHLRSITRREAYLADITYGINSEYGFDYLRDNMATNSEEMVQRGFNYAIIDEADSVLIDEARTPHIISAPYDEDTSKYYRYSQVIKTLDPVTDYLIDEKQRTANLTEAGILKIETNLGVENIYEKDFDTLYHLEAALKADALFKNNKDYIVKDNEVIIVDEFTGRLLPGRRFSEGLHQAIEAKENVSIQRESKTLATVSLQNYFRMYDKIAGMTGTASTEAEEFHKIYKTDVLVIPTDRKMIRADHPDMIYKTEKAKYNAVIEEISKHYQTGRPVLVGTVSIDKNELLSQLLNKKGIPHQLLNAKNHLQEAQIIADAGKKGAVTIATNMAGRGVDIILGGQKEELKVKSEKLKVKAQEEWQKQHDEVVSLGGLYVIGTERHESRRIDNQLRGRAGRQGDPGETRFFVALQDDLMRIFGGDQISKIMTFFNFPEDQPLTHSMVSKAIEQAQVKVEGYNFDIRKHLVDYDDVINRQRQILYGLRNKLMQQKNSADFKEALFSIFQKEINQITQAFFVSENEPSDEQKDLFSKEVNMILQTDSEKIQAAIKTNNAEKISDELIKVLESAYEQRQKKYGKDLWTNVVGMICLSTIDKYWTDHLTAVEDLREGINLRGYAQMDPLVEYKNEAFKMFEKLINDINYEITRRIFRVEIDVKERPTIEKRENAPVLNKPGVTYSSASAIDPFTQKQQKQKEAQVDSTSKLPSSNTNPQPDANDIGFKVILPGETKKQPGRNDPCWCGSGKKYKRCHYPN